MNIVLNMMKLLVNSILIFFYSCHSCFIIVEIVVEDITPNHSNQLFNHFFSTLNFLLNQESALMEMTVPVYIVQLETPSVDTTSVITKLLHVSMKRMLEDFV